MRILNTNYVSAKVTKNCYQCPQQTYFMNSNTNDSFELTESSVKKVSFRASLQDVCKKIMQDPKLCQQFMGLMAIGTAAFVATANVDDIEQKENIDAKQDSGSNDNNIINNFFESLFKNKNYKTDEDIILENKKIKAENEALMSENQKLKKQLSENAKNKNQVIESNSQDELITIQFPKVKGNHTKFKNIIEKVKIHEEFGTKLTRICQEILAKSGTINKEDFINTLASKIGNVSELERYIDEIYQTLQSKEKEADITNEVNNANDTNSTKEANLCDDGSSQKDSNNTSVRRACCANKGISVDANETKFTLKDITNKVYNFRIPGTISSDYKKNLTALLVKFEENFTATFGRSKWMYRQAIKDNVSEADIINEINNRKYGKSPYKNITSAKAPILLQILQNDKRYSEMFTLHSALRFIDRFIDFNSYVSVKEQSSKNLNDLFLAINKALSQGVRIEAYQDCNHGAHAARLIIEPNLDKNPEAFKLAGSFPLMITICENQPKMGYYNTRMKKPLISTIFADNN